MNNYCSPSADFNNPRKITATPQFIPLSWPIMPLPSQHSLSPSTPHYPSPHTTSIQTHQTHPVARLRDCSPSALSLKFFKLCAFHTAFPTACRGGACSSRCTKQFCSYNPRKSNTTPRHAPLSWLMNALFVSHPSLVSH